MLQDQIYFQLNCKQVLLKTQLFYNPQMCWLFVHTNCKLLDKYLSNKIYVIKVIFSLKTFFNLWILAARNAPAIPKNMSKQSIESLKEN